MVFLACYIFASGAECGSANTPRHARIEPRVIDISLASGHRCTHTKEASSHPKIHLLHRRGDCHLLRRQYVCRVQEPDVPRVLHPQSPRWYFCHPIRRRSQLGHNHHKGCDQLSQIRSRHGPAVRLRPDRMGKPPGETFPDHPGHCPVYEQGCCSVEG